MARPVGLPKTGGRKKGSKNRRSLVFIGTTQELDIDPFELLLYFAKGDWEALGFESEFIGEGKYRRERITPEMRIQACIAACPYVYPKLKPIDYLPEKDEQRERTFASMVLALTAEAGDTSYQSLPSPPLIDASI